jgi:cell division protein FtsZ
LRKLAEGTDLIFLVAGLGGGTGSGLAPVLAAAAREAGALVLAIVTLPFDFEGPRRSRQAAAGLQNLRAAADAVICLPNQKISKLLDGQTTLVDAFQHTNELLAQGVRGIWRMLTRPGLINVDFAYLHSVLRGRHVESALATACASGENRTRDVVSQIVENPLFDEGQMLAEADEVIVSLAAGPDLTISEINKVMEQISRRLEKGNLILGTTLDPEMTGRISLTDIAARHGRHPSAPEAASEEAATRASFTAAAPDGFDSSFFVPAPAPRPAPRFKAPAPETTPELAAGLIEKSGKGRKGSSKWKQELLQLEVISKSRFEKSKPTIHRGADLDVPTYIRRGVPLN